MVDEIFKNTCANFDKLVQFGFHFNGEVYEFKTDIIGGDFELIVFVSKDSKVSTKVIDNNSEDEYVLHLTKETVGEFVGKVRTDFEKVLTEIKDKCFEKSIFKSEQAKQIVSYIRSKYGDELEFLWEKFPTNAIWRRKDNSKWYGALLVLSKRKLGVDSDETVDIIDLRVDPKEIESIVDNKKYFAGYHMNKKNWITICLDGSVSTQTIYDLVDSSYILAKKWDAN